MPLPFKVESLDNVPEAQRSLYVQDGDTFRLDLDGYEDPTGLKSALEQERKAKRDAEAKAKEKDKLLKGIDPDEAREALKMKQELEEKKLVEEGEVDKLVEKRLERFRQDSETQKKEIQQERDALKDELHKLKIKTAIQETANDGRSVRSGAMDMVVNAFEKMFSIDEKGQVVAKDDNGNVIYGKDGTNPLSIKEHMESFAKDHEYLFVPSNGGGGPGNDKGGGGNNTPNSYNNMETAKMSPSARLAAARQIDQAKGENV